MYINRKPSCRRSIYHHYQPIYNIVNMEIIGFEALLRSKFYSSPEDVFKAADTEKKLYELDMGSIHKAMLSYLQAGKLKRNNYLFLNVLPSTVLNSRFVPSLTKIIAENDIRSQQIILELSENEMKHNYQELKIIVSELRDLGIKIALDDVGKGYSNVQAMLEIEADYIKLDRYMAFELHLSKKKQLFIELIVDFYKQYDGFVVLEGIEKEEEKNIALELGINFGQGYGLCKPLELEGVK